MIYMVLIPLLLPFWMSNKLAILPATLPATLHRYPSNPYLDVLVDLFDTGHIMRLVEANSAARAHGLLTFPTEEGHQLLGVTQAWG